MSDLLRRARRARIEATARPGAWISVTALLLISVAYSLRTSTLTLQSMWIDEIMALRYTSGDLAETMRMIVRPEHNGPLFYLVLYGWRQLVGESDFALRYMSVACSVLTLPLLYQWVKRLLGSRTALVAVWLLSFSPFTLWFAQELKMYALHMMLGAAVSLALLEAFRKGGWFRWTLYALLASTVLYSHLFGVFLIISHVLVALLLGWRNWRRLFGYVLSMGILTLAHLPLVSFGVRVLRGYQPRDVWRGFIPLDEIVRDMISYYFCRVPFIDVPWQTFVLALGLGVVGALALLLSRRRAAGIVLLQAFAPVLVFYPMSFKVPVYDAKYLSASLPAIFAVVAWACVALARFWRPLGALLLVLGMLMQNGAVRDLSAPAFQRGDWRFVAEYVDEHEGTNDLVIVFAHYVTRAFERYYQGGSFVRPFAEDPYDPWPFYQRQVENYDNLWLVLHHDQAMAPENSLRQVAGTAFPVITEQYPNMGRIALIGYQMRYAYPALPAGVTELDACFENGVCLVGYQLDAVSLPPTERLSHPPSNWIHIVLYWQREDDVDDAAFRPLVRVVDDSFNVWGGNMERRPDLFDRFPLGDWPIDEVIGTHFDLNLNPLTPPGVYRLEVSLAADGDENNRLEVVGAAADQPQDRLLFETVQIEPGG